MKKVVLISSGGAIQDIQVDEHGDTLRTLQHLVGGYIQPVSMLRLELPYMMIINEEAKIYSLPVNRKASYLFGSDTHGDWIHGPAVICKVDVIDEETGEEDIVLLTEVEAQSVVKVLKQYFETFFGESSDPDPEEDRLHEYAIKMISETGRKMEVIIEAQSVEAAIDTMEGRYPGYAALAVDELGGAV